MMVRVVRLFLTIVIQLLISKVGLTRISQIWFLHLHVKISPVTHFQAFSICCPCSQSSFSCLPICFPFNSSFSVSSLFLCNIIFYFPSSLSNLCLTNYLTSVNILYKTPVYMAQKLKATYKRKHAEFFILSLGSLTQYDCFQIHPFTADFII